MSWAQADTERRVASLIRIGTVASVDGATARVVFQEGTESAALPVAAPRAGGIHLWAPPTPGEQVVVACPGGDTSQGIIVGSVPSGSNAPPSSAPEFVVALGASRLTITGSEITMTAGGTVLRLSSAGLSIEGAAVTHGGTEIGRTHRHGGVAPGGGESGPPL